MATTSITTKNEMERNIVAALVRDGLKAGYYLSVDNGDGLEIKPTADEKTILAALFATSSETLLFFDANDCKKSSTPRTHAELVYGNEGYNVISDYGMRVEDFWHEAFALQEKYEAEYEAQF